MLTLSTWHHFQIMVWANFSNTCNDICLCSAAILVSPAVFDDVDKTAVISRFDALQTSMIMNAVSQKSIYTNVREQHSCLASKTQRAKDLSSMWSTTVNNSPNSLVLIEHGWERSILDKVCASCCVGDLKTYHSIGYHSFMILYFHTLISSTNCLVLLKALNVVGAFYNNYYS